MTQLAGRTALVTGAGSAAGRAIVAELAAAGARVCAADAEREAAEIAAEAAGAVALDADAADPAAMATLGARVAALIGPIDILVLADTAHPPAAGLSEDAALEEHLRRVTRPLHLAARHLIPDLRARGTGAVLALAGERSRAAAPDPWSAGAQGWLLAALRALALDLGPQGVRVNALVAHLDLAPALPSFLAGSRPGAMATSARARALSRIPMGRFATPQDVGRAAVFLCSDQAALITGMVFDIDGGRSL